MKHILTFITCLLLAAGAQANDFLKPEEIKSLLVGKKILARFSSGAVFDFQMNEDNTTSTSLGGGDVGKWRLSDDGYCTSWVKIRKGAEVCVRVSKRSFGQYVVVYPDGSLVLITRID